jgi:hypothetical protein
VTVASLAAIVFRRWYVFAAGLMVTASVFMVCRQPQPVYWTQAEMVFVDPGNAGIKGLNAGWSSTLIDFAGIVGQKVDEGQDSIELTSPEATLYGAGIRQGHSVRLFENGGQWARAFNRPVLAIQIVDSSEERVRTELDRLTNDISRTAIGLQAAKGANRKYFITAERTPQEITVLSFGQTRSGSFKGAAALLTVGTGASMATSVLIDRILLWRGVRRRQLVSETVDAA